MFLDDMYMSITNNKVNAVRCKIVECVYIYIYSFATQLHQDFSMFEHSSYIWNSYRHNEERLTKSFKCSMCKLIKEIMGGIQVISKYIASVHKGLEHP